MNAFMVSNEIDSAKCVGQVGKLSGVVKRVKDMVPLVTAVCCSIHRWALATKMMAVNLKKVSDEAVTTVKFIRSHSLQSVR